MAALRGVNRSAAEGGKIHTGVRRARLAIEDAALAEISTLVDALQRKLKVSAPQFLRGHTIEQFPQLLLFRDGPRCLLLVRLDKLFFHLEALGGKFSGPD